MIDIHRMDNFLDQCLTSFELDEQLDILQEECAELIKACSKFKRSKDKIEASRSRENMVEELAHVLISSSVVSRIYCIGPSEIIREINKKADKYGFDNICTEKEDKNED